jgi:hypothetical protein
MDFDVWVESLLMSEEGWVRLAGVLIKLVTELLIAAFLTTLGRVLLAVLGGFQQLPAFPVPAPEVGELVGLGFIFSAVHDSFIRSRAELLSESDGE